MFGYLLCPLHEYAPEQPFSGRFISNPYSDLANTIPLKVNFHAHSVAHGGWTDGQDTEEAVLEHYLHYGYDIPTLSNYQSISPHKTRQTLYIPAYEHGYGIFKFHQLCLGAKKVIWQDFPLWSSIDNKQYILDRLKPTAQVVAICHPAFTKLLSLEDIARLSNYDLIEVTRGELLTTEHWDAALSAGRLVYGISNDDSHTLSKELDYFRRCNLVFVQEPTVENVYQSLRNGKTIAVWVPGIKLPDQRLEISESLKSLLKSIDFDQNILSVSLNQPAKRITFIGQNGTVRKEQNNSELGEYTFTPEDTYIRTEIEFESGIIFLLNPFVRHDGSLDTYLSLNRINWAKTVLYVTIRLIIFGIIVYFCARIFRRKEIQRVELHRKMGESA